MKYQLGVLHTIPGAISVLFLLLSLPVSASEVCYLDTPPGYQRMGGKSRLGSYSSSGQCESIRQQYFGTAGTCSCTPTPPNYQPQPNTYRGKIQGGQEEDWRQPKEEEKKQGLKQAEEEAKGKFDKAKEDALKLMKGTGNNTLTIKTGTESFNTKENKQSGMKIKSGMPEEVVDSAGKTWACATSIADFAFLAARRGETGEVRYLGEQVRKTLSGDKPGVDCPKLSPPPNVEGIEIGPNSPAVNFYGALLGAVVTQVERVGQVKQEMAAALGQKQVSEEDIQSLEEEQKTLEDKERKARIASTTLQGKGKAEIKKQEEKPKEEVKTSVSENEKKKKRALAEALAALGEAREAKKKIDEYELLHKKVQANPSMAENLTGSIGK